MFDAPNSMKWVVCMGPLVDRYMDLPISGNMLKYGPESVDMVCIGWYD